MTVEIRPYDEGDLAGMVQIWNEVVTAGNAFPQEDLFGVEEARDFFAQQSWTAVAVDGEDLLGLYILHPNNIERCAHVANASYAVLSSARGRGVGRKLVSDSLEQAGRLGFRGLQFNAVVASNTGAIHLYETLGFAYIGTIPGGFRNGEGVYEDIRIYYHACA